MNTSNNRRSALTKKIFQETLIELLQSNHISEISVKKLAGAADMNRSTFYAHYQNQMDVLRELEEETYERVQSFMMSGLQPAGNADSLMIFKQLLQFIRENAKLFLVLLGQNGSQDFQQKLMELTEEAAASGGYRRKQNDARFYYTKIYRIAGCTRVIEEWIIRDFDQPINALAKQLIALSSE